MSASVANLHAPKDARGTDAAKGAEDACPTCGRTCTDPQVKGLRGPVNPTRRHYANVAAADLADAFGVNRGSWQEWADRMGIRRQVAQRFGVVDGPRVALGDVLMAPREVAIRLLGGLAKRLRGVEEPPALPPTIDQTLHHARSELADVDKVLTPGAQHSVEVLLRAKVEADESLKAAALLMAHIDELLARAGKGQP